MKNMQICININNGAQDFASLGSPPVPFILHWMQYNRDAQHLGVVFGAIHR